VENRRVLARELRIIRTLYWTLWFVVAPLCLALVLVWGLTPPSGVDPAGAIGWIESAVREQPVPVVIVAFTLFEMALWAARHELPFAHHALPPLRAGVPENLRGPFERARALLDEADGIFATHEKAVVRELSTKERDQLKTDLDALRAAIDKTPFDEDYFLDSLTKADGEVDVRLRPWRKSELREYLESILVAVGVALALRAFVVEAFKIPSGSMIPTLQIGDHIFVNKFIYGPAIPWTHSRVWTHMPPKRADVIVHAFPEHPEQDFIKRVIAIPGDKLEARSGHPWINGWEVPSCSVGLYSYTELDSASPKHDADLFVEYLGEEAYLTLYDRATGGFPEYQGPFYAKPGEVWVMGDNRNNSHDSRMWWGGQGGGVPFENIKGRALFVWLSVLDGKIDWTRFGVPVMGRPRLPSDMAALQPALDKCFRDRPPIEKTTPPLPSKTAGQMSGPDNEERPGARP
jgi:signal peptidase I